MEVFQPKCWFITLKCGKLRWKCEKLTDFQGFESWSFNFSTHETRGKVKKLPRYYTNAENINVEKNKFSTSPLTEFMQKKVIYSSSKKLFLYILHKNHVRFKNIKVPRLKNKIDKIICSIYIPTEAQICKCSCRQTGWIIILMTDNSARIVAKNNSLIT